MTYSWGRSTAISRGDYYLVEALARDSETNEPCVIYRKLYGDGGLLYAGRFDGYFRSASAS